MNKDHINLLRKKIDELEDRSSDKLWEKESVWNEIVCHIDSADKKSRMLKRTAAILLLVFLIAGLTYDYYKGHLGIVNTSDSASKKRTVSKVLPDLPKEIPGSSSQSQPHRTKPVAKSYSVTGTEQAGKKRKLPAFFQDTSAISVTVQDTANKKIELPLTQEDPPVPLQIQAAPGAGNILEEDFRFGKIKSENLIFGNKEKLSIPKNRNNKTKKRNTQ